MVEGEFFLMESVFGELDCFLINISSMLPIFSKKEKEDSSETLSWGSVRNKDRRGHLGEG